MSRRKPHEHRRRPSHQLPFKLRQELVQLGHLESSPPPFRKRPNPRPALPAPARSQAKRGKTIPSRRLARAGEDASEDAQIEWLERKLGVCNGAVSGADLRDEFAQDGLEDLFDELDQLDALIDCPAVEDSVLDEDLPASENHDDDDSWSGIGSDGDDTNTGDPDEHESDPHRVVTSSTSASASQSKEINPAGLGDFSKPVDRSHVYTPPQLRTATRSPAHRHGPAPDSDIRLRRALQGVLNRISPDNLSTSMASLRPLYQEFSRAVLSEALVTLVLDTIGVSERLHTAMASTHAAFVCAIARGGVGLSGIEAGWLTGLAARLSERLCRIYPDSSRVNLQAESVKGLNLLNLLVQLYLFDAIKCVLVFNFAQRLSSADLTEERVEALLLIFKAAGPRLRSDDPAALKRVIIEVQEKASAATPNSSRARFMMETLVNLKNNRLRKFSGGADSDPNQHLFKYLASVTKQSGVRFDALGARLDELLQMTDKGAWWRTGVPWAGNPLVDYQHNDVAVRQLAHSESTQDPVAELARRQGMNTSVRQSIFSALVTSEDYTDACDRIDQLGLTEVQQREVIRVLIHCLEKEPIYNPFYTLVGQRLATLSRSASVTMRYCFWDLLRECGQEEVAGASLTSSVPARRRSPDLAGSKHVSQAYGWWIAKDCLSLGILKPVNFASLSPAASALLTSLLSSVLLSTQAASPTLAKSSMPSKLNRSRLEDVINKVAGLSSLRKGLAAFLAHKFPLSQGDSFERKLVDQAEELLARL